MDVREALADVAAFGPFFTVSTEDARATDDPAGSGWLPVDHLYSDPEPLRARIAHVRAALHSDDRVAASIAFHGIAAQLVSAPFAAVVLHGVVPRLPARSLFWRPVEAGPWQLWCPEPVGVAVATAHDGAAALADALFAEHLVPLVAAVRAQVAVSERVLWGNVASSVASGKRLVVVERPDLAGRAAAVAQRLLAAGPLAGTGERMTAAGPDRGWSLRRRSCCLYYRVPASRGGLCEDCVLHARRPR